MGGYFLIKYSLLFISMLYFIQRVRPVIGLEVIDAGSLAHLLNDNSPTLKILDVRDQVDFYAGHIGRALNISLGRLPYVKKTELLVDDKIIIIADSKNDGRKAARILKKSGYRNLSYLDKGMFAYENLQKTKSNYCRLQACKSI